MENGRNCDKSSTPFSTMSADKAICTGNCTVQINYTLASSRVLMGGISFIDFLFFFSTHHYKSQYWDRYLAKQVSRSSQSWWLVKVEKKFVTIPRSNSWESEVPCIC